MPGDQRGPLPDTQATQSAGTVSVEDVLINHELVSERTPDHAGEIHALTDLIVALAEAPDTILQTLVETALALCGGESAGISILEGDRFRWYAVAGEWAHFVGGGMPRSASPCGTVLDRDTALLFSQPGRFFPEMAKVDPLAASALLVPFHAQGEPIGTVWVVSHRPERRFDQEDLRLLTSVARFAAGAYQAFANLGLEARIEERTRELSIRNASLVSLAGERDHLIHDLEVHQTELEAQNRQLRESQHLLEESRARYSDLYDFAPVAYCTLSLAGCVTDINLTGATLLETARGSLMGKPLAVFLAPTHRAAFRAYLEKRRTDPQHDALVELELGSSKVIRMASTLVLDRNGATVAYRAALSDITDLKHAEDALRLAVRMRQDFLAVVSHDLRNPLNSITLGAQVLLETLSAETNAFVGIERIDRAATRMTRMLSDLLDLSSMDAGHLSMDRQPEDVAPLLSAVVESQRIAATEKLIGLEVESTSSDLVAYCDRDRISQVLTNLVGNAIKFSHRGAAIRIEARRCLDVVEIAVRDSGAGIEASQLERIFDPYWQAASTAKKGTGLGLSIAKGIVEAHRGRIWAESKPRHGSTFFFTLPIAAPPVEESVKDSNDHSASGSGPLPRLPRTRSRDTESPDRYSILIVDDEPDTRTLLATVLEAQGYEVTTAANGAEALEALRNANPLPRIILLDLVMPTMDGWAFLDARSEDLRLAAIPVVLISGQMNARETARARGLAGFVTKPIETIALLRMLVSLVRAPATN